MARVRAEHGKALHQAGGHGRSAAYRTERGHHAAVQPAVGLVEKAAVPVDGHADLKTDGVAGAVHRAGALFHLAFDEAVRRRLGGVALQGDRAFGDHLCRGDARVGQREALGQRGAVFQRGGCGGAELRWGRGARCAGAARQPRGGAKGHGQGRQGEGARERVWHAMSPGGRGKGAVRKGPGRNGQGRGTTCS